MLKKGLSFFVALVICACALSVTAFAAISGSGTSASPYLISTEADLRQFAANVNAGDTYQDKYVKLNADITLTQEWTPIGTATTSFCGVFDGNGKTITGLASSNSSTNKYVGLFAYVGDATIQAVTLSEVSLTGKEYVAGIAAKVDAGTGTAMISGCHVSGSINGDPYSGNDLCQYVGGIAGYATVSSGTVIITNCTVEGTVAVDINSGGIVGFAGSTEGTVRIDNCTNYASIAAGNNSAASAGIVGKISNASVVSCINYGAVSGNRTSDERGSSYLGGIAGEAGSTIFTGCANYGTVSTWFAAGIASNDSGCSFITCLNAGSINGNSDGYAYGISSGTTVNTYYENCCDTSSRSSYSENKNIRQVTSAQLSSGEAAYLLGSYFGQNIGTDETPVPRTESNRVFRVTISGAVDKTLYVTAGNTLVLPETAAPMTYTSEDVVFDENTVITKDWVLVAACVEHKFAESICTVCGTEAPVKTSGTCGVNGDNLTWKFHTDGTLVISGTGDMKDFGPYPDWRCYSTNDGQDIKAVVIKPGVTSVGEYAFHYLENMKTAKIPEGVTKLGGSAFEGSGLVTIDLPKSLAEFDVYTFFECKSLTAINVASGNAAYCSADGVVYSADKTKLVRFPCGKAGEYTVPEGTSTIGKYAFRGTVNLTKIVFPESVTYLDYQVIGGSTALTEVEFMGAAPTFDSNAFNGQSALTAYYHSSKGGWTNELHGQGSTGKIVWVNLDVNPDISGGAVASGAVITPPANGWVNGTNTFTVSHSVPCVVAVSHDDGASYITLTGTSVENGYSFTADNMTADTQIAVVIAGDTNGDGKLDVTDTVRLRAGLLGKITLNGLEALASDVNNTGNLDVTDAVRLRALLLGKTALSW